MKKMFLILKQNGRKYWTNSYEKKDGFVAFSISTKAGKTLDFKINLSVIEEISEHELPDDLKPLDKK
jgi:hypothetical protein